MSTLLENEWAKKEASKEPQLAGKAAPTASEYFVFKELAQLIEEQKERIDSLEQLIQPVNESTFLCQFDISLKSLFDLVCLVALFEQLGIAPSDFMGDGSTIILVNTMSLC